MADEMRDLLNSLDRRLRAMERRPQSDAHYVHGVNVPLDFRVRDGDNPDYLGEWKHGQAKPPVVWWASPKLGTSLVVIVPHGTPGDGLVYYKAWNGWTTQYTGYLSQVHCVGLFPR